MKSKVGRGMRLLAVLGAAGGLFATQCGEGPTGENPNSGDPSEGSNDIEIHKGDSLLFARSPVVDSVWETNDLVPLPGLGLEQNPPRKDRFWVSFRSSQVTETRFTVKDEAHTTISLKTTPELHLFTRNPQEFYDTLVGLPVDRWDAEIHTPKIGPDFSGTPPYRLPVDVVLPYNFRQPLTYRVVDPLLPDAFWRIDPSSATSPSDWFGIGSDPADFGSIKGARYISLPQCSRSVPLQPLFEQISAPINTVLNSRACRRGTWLDIATDLQNLTVVQYLAHQVPVGAPPRTPETGMRSGALLGGRVHAQYTSDFLNSFCSIDFAYDYEYALNEGFIAVIPHKIYITADDPTKTVCSGFGFPLDQDGALTIIENLLETQIPQSLLAISKDLQQFPPVDQADSGQFAGPEWSCQ